jgi:anti-sigma factor RsiW
MAELSALADGTLPADRRAEVEARVAASPELQELVERQRQAVLAAQRLTSEESDWHVSTHSFGPPLHSNVRRGPGKKASASGARDEEGACRNALPRRM